MASTATITQIATAISAAIMARDRAESAPPESPPARRAAAVRSRGSLTAPAVADAPAADVRVAAVPLVAVAAPAVGLMVVAMGAAGLATGAAGLATVGVPATPDAAEADASDGDASDGDASDGDASDGDASDGDVATRGAALMSRLADAAAGCVIGDCVIGECVIGECVIGGGAGRDGRDVDVLAAIFSATRSSAAMIAAGSGASALAESGPMRAPAVAAVEHPADRLGSSDKAGVCVSDRHRSSHSSMVPPQPLTYADSTGRSGSAGPASAALMQSCG